MMKKNSASPHLTFVGFFFKISLPLMDNRIMIFNFFCLTSDFNFILKVFTNVKHLFIPNSNRYRPTLIFINCVNVTIFKDQSISLLVRQSITRLFDYLYPYHLVSFFQRKDYFHFDYCGQIILR